MRMPPLTLILTVVMSMSAFSAQACSEFLMPGNGPVVSARTMDFEMNQYNTAVFVPRGLHWWSDSPYSMIRGVDWRNKYGFVAMDIFGGVPPIRWLLGRKYTDGLNEAGLSAAVLWLDASIFPKIRLAEAKKALSVRDLVSYTLGNFDTVEKVKDGLAKVKVWQQDLVGIVEFQLHLIVHDNLGKSALFEWVNGKMNVYDEGNKYVGVTTNDPIYPEMVKHLQPYDDLTNEDHVDKRTGEFIEGSGLTDLPGDFTPISRFARSALLKRFALTAPPLAEPESLAADAWKVQQAFHIIRHNQATVGENYHDDFGSKFMGGRFYTLWTVVRDHTNRKIYFTGTRNQSPRVIDLNQLDFSKGYTHSLATMDEYANPIEVSMYDPAQTLNADADYESGALTLAVTVTVPKAAAGMSGHYYIFAKTAAGKIMNFTGRSWQEAGEGQALVPCASGALTTREFTVLTASEATSWIGARFFSGYGASEWEMYLQGQFGMVYELTAATLAAKQ
jgi:choloylglycine hydrolase